MADILINGMEMPKDCNHCPCAYFTEGAWRDECRLTGQEIQDCDAKMDGCPLHELPEHGDVIDKEKLYDLVKQRGRNWAGEWCDSECHITGNDIKTAPVIVPASKEDAK